jgi:hypothetical protein
VTADGRPVVEGRKSQCEMFYCAGVIMTARRCGPRGYKGSPGRHLCLHLLFDRRLPHISRVFFVFCRDESR